MQSKKIGFFLIALGIILTVVVFGAKVREDAYIDQIVLAQGSCFDDAGECIHDDRDWTLYLVGWILSAALVLLGIYLFFFDKAHVLLKSQHEQLTTELKEAKTKDEFKAFLKGFSAEEQQVLKAIHEQEGIQQSTLRYRTGIPKATLSQIVKNLENRGFLTKKPAGKTNELFLKKEF